MPYRKALILSLFMLGVIFMSGCGTEVSDRIFVRAVYIGDTADGVMVAVEYSENGEKKVGYSEEGNLSRAVDEMSDRTGKDIFFGHCGAVFISLESGDVFKKSDYLISDKKIPPEAVVCVCEDEGVLYADNIDRVGKIAEKSVEKGKLPDSRIMRIVSAECGGNGVKVPFASVDGESVILSEVKR